MHAWLTPALAFCISNTLFICTGYTGSLLTLLWSRKKLHAQEGAGVARGRGYGERGRRRGWDG
jgi:hypothetical protein